MSVAVKCNFRNVIHIFNICSTFYFGKSSYLSPRMKMFFRNIRTDSKLNQQCHKFRVVLIFKIKETRSAR